MTRITILGGTGYAGSNIAREAVARGHEVTVYSRTAPSDPIGGVRYEQGSATDRAVLERAVAGADVVIEALSPRGDMTGELPGIVRALGELAAASGTRLGVVGGWGSLRPEPGAQRFAENGSMPPAYVGESLEMAEALGWLQNDAPSALDWFYVSPAASFGAHSPGEKTGSFSFGGETTDSVDSSISGADFGLAIVDEIEKHERSGHISVWS